MHFFDRTRTAPSTSAGLAWPVTLGLAACGGSLLGGCAMPFVALATIAAVTMPRKIAGAMVIIMWLINQTVGFTVLHYPHTAQTFAWGGVLGLASVTALFVAQVCTKGRTQGLAGLLGTLGLSFLGYQTGIFAFANIIGLTCPFTPSVILQVALNDALWFVLLYALHLVVRSATPTWFQPEMVPNQR